MSATLLEDSLGGFLDSVASGDPAPGGGAVAAIAVSMAASLVAMTARFSDGHTDGAHDLVRRAEELRTAVAPLAQADGDAYGRVLAAYRLPREPDPHARKEAVEQALAGAAKTPLAVAEAAADIAAMAAELAEEGNPNLRGDAVTSALLADAASGAAAVLVALNLRPADPADRRAAMAESFASAASAAARRALSSLSNSPTEL